MKLTFVIIFSSLCALLTYQNCSKKNEDNYAYATNQQSLDTHDITLSKIPLDYSTDTNPIIEFSTLSTDITVCTIDDATIEPCTSPVQLTDLSEGEHDFSVYLKNNSTVKKISHWIVDTKNPQLTIANPPPAITPRKNFNINFSIADTTIVSSTCSLNSGTFESCTSPISLTNLNNGNYKLDINSVDLAGNAKVTTLTWTVDSTAWTIDFTSTPPTYNDLSFPKFLFTAHNSDSSEFATKFLCSFDNGSFADCSVLSSPNVYQRTILNIQEGTHSLKVKARQSNGLYTPEIIYNWTSDFTPPVVTLEPQTESFITDGTVTFNFSATDKYSKIHTYECMMQSRGANTDCGSGVTYNNLEIGTYIFSVRALDMAGNISASATASIRVLEKMPTSHDMGAREVEIKTIGNTYYVLNTKGLGIYDTSSGNPKLLSYMNLSRHLQNRSQTLTFALKDTTLFISTYDSLLVFDIKDKTTPLLISKIYTYYIDFLHTFNNVLYAGNSKGLLTSYNIQNPEKITAIHSLQAAPTAPNISRWGASANYIVILNGKTYPQEQNSEITFIDVRVPENLKISYSQNVPFLISFANIKIWNNRLVIASRMNYNIAGKLSVYDVSKVPTNLPLISSQTIDNGRTQDTYLQNWTLASGHAYIPEIKSDNTGQIISIYNVQKALLKVGEIEFLEHPDLLKIINSKDNKLHLRQQGILDIESYSTATPSAPVKQYYLTRLFNECSTRNDSCAVIKNNFVYMSGNKQIYIISTSDITKPTLLKSISSKLSQGNKMFISGTNLYVLGAKFNSARTIVGSVVEQYDITDPANPVLKNSLDNTTYWYGINAFNGWFVGITHKDVTLFDMNTKGRIVKKNTTALSSIGTCYLTHHMHGRILYVICSSGGGLNSKLNQINISGGTLTVMTTIDIPSIKVLLNPVVYKNHLYITAADETHIFSITAMNELIQKPKVAEGVHYFSSHNSFVIKENELIFSSGQSMDFTDPLIPKVNGNYFPNLFQASEFITLIDGKFVGYGNGFDYY